MNLSLNYARGANNTISVADKQNIYLGTIFLNPFNMLGFKQERSLSRQEEQEINFVCNRIQEVV